MEISAEAAAGAVRQKLDLTLGPAGLWAFSTVVEDIALRKSDYEALDSSLARKVVARRFPEGMTVRKTESRVTRVGETGGGHGQCQRTIFVEILEKLKSVAHLLEDRDRVRIAVHMAKRRDMARGRRARLGDSKFAPRSTPKPITSRMAGIARHALACVPLALREMQASPFGECLLDVRVHDERSGCDSVWFSSGFRGAGEFVFVATFWNI